MWRCYHFPGPNEQRKGLITEGEVLLAGEEKTCVISSG